MDSDRGSAGKQARLIVREDRRDRTEVRICAG